MTNRVVQSWPERWDLIVIPCGAKKRPSPTVAHRLYTGPYFQACFNTAVLLAASEYRILSARHGFLRFEEYVEPYEQRMDRPGAITLDALRLQVADQGLDRSSRVLGLCGGPYRRALTALWPSAVCPLLGGIGKQMQQLKGMRDRITVPSRGYWWE